MSSLVVGFEEDGAHVQSSSSKDNQWGEKIVSMCYKKHLT